MIECIMGLQNVRVLTPCNLWIPPYMAKGTLHMWVSEQPSNYNPGNPGLSGWYLNVITYVLIRGSRGRDTRQYEGWSKLLLKVLQMEKEATSQGIGSRIWKKQQNRFYLRASGGSTALPILWFQPRKLLVGFQPAEAQENKLMLF